MSFTLKGITVGGRTLAYVPQNGDPYWANVQLLAHMNGTNGGTTFTDNSSAARTITPSSVTTSTTQIKFGSASAYFNNGVAPNVPVLNVSNTGGALNLGANNFTIETWLYRTATTAASSIAGTLQWQTGYRGGWRMGLNSSGTMWFQCSTATSGSPTTVFTTSGAVPLNTWTAVSVTRSGNNFYGFINGTQSGTGSFTGTISTPTQFTNNLRIGAKISDGGSFDDKFVGYIDEMRITVGVARYTSSYTVATEEFPNS